MDILKGKINDYIHNMFIVNKPEEVGHLDVMTLFVLGRIIVSL